MIIIIIIIYVKKNINKKGRFILENTITSPKLSIIIKK